MKPPMWDRCDVPSWVVATVTMNKTKNATITTVWSIGLQSHTSKISTSHTFYKKQLLRGGSSKWQPIKQATVHAWGFDNSRLQTLVGCSIVFSRFGRERTLSGPKHTSWWIQNSLQCQQWTNQTCQTLHHWRPPQLCNFFQRLHWRNCLQDNFTDFRKRLNFALRILYRLKPNNCKMGCRGSKLNVRMVHRCL
jgi:hypothetical protein